MTDKYLSTAYGKSKVNSLQIQGMRYEMMNSSTLFVDNNGNYNGITMEIDHEGIDKDGSTNERKEYLEDIDRLMDKYEEYVARNGKLNSD